MCANYISLNKPPIFTKYL